MKICHFEINDEDRSLLAQFAPDYPELSSAETKNITEALDKSNVSVAADAEIVSVFVNSAVDKAIIDQLPKLKLLLTRSTGFDHIDCAYAASKGITVTYIPSYGSRAVAEYTFALMLGLSRKTFQASHHLKSDQSFDYTAFEGFNLQGKTLGVIGTGRIGQEVIKIAHGFDLNIVAYDLFPNTNKAQELNFQYLSLNDLLSQSDIITLHVPASPQTHHLINSTNIGHIKKGAILINTARGDIIETAALLEGLQQKILSGVGLDVLEDERELKDELELLTAGGRDLHQEQMKILLENHMLLDQPNVAITPHIAFFSKEAKHEIIKSTVENIAKFLEGQPQNIVKL